MHGNDTRGRRPTPQPTDERRNRRRLAGGDDLDTAVDEILDPPVELQALGLVGRRRAVIDALHAAGHDATNRLA